ncbi:MAG: tetratricopeptide repeat protein [Bacteriovoracaceae bacterium]|nr:tetratricopeptide repeat protein [Bacteriovoracaceae bacterium]
MKKYFKYLLILTIIGFCNPVLSNDVIEQSKTFLVWLESHRADIEKCTPTIVSNGYQLCDNTFINKELLIKLYKMTAEELVNFIKSENISIKVFCMPDNKLGNFQKFCIPNEQNEAQKNAKLQGQFHPDTNTIDIQSDAYIGSLIHEYIHYLQYKNENIFFGKRYKFERAQIQQALIKLMDTSTIEVEKYLKEKDDANAKIHVAKVLQASEQLMQYSPWQDLIDERNIFLLYKNLGQEFGVSDEDIALATKNMGFICKRFKLPGDQCAIQAESGLTGVSKEVERILKEVRPKYSNQLLEKFIKNLPKFSPLLSLENKISRLNRYIFDELKMKADNSYLSRNNEDNFLPDSTLKFKKAHCLGITLLYLIAAENLNIKAYFVRAPSHVFPRFCDETKCLNIETLNKGLITSDQYYVDNLFITKKNIEEGYYLKNLAKLNDLSASLYLGLGFVAGTNHQWELAEYFYKKSINNSRGFSEGYSNLAAIYFQQGRPDMAKTYLEIALKINPDLVSAIINMGALNQKLKNDEKALDYYDKALAINPTAIEAYRKKADILIKNKKIKEAFINFEKILIVQPKFCDVIKDQIQITEDGKIKKIKMDYLEKLQKKHECLKLPL